jgi:hypothetical protein
MSVTTVALKLHRLAAVALVVVWLLVPCSAAAEEIRIDQPPHGAARGDAPASTPAPGISDRDPRGDHAPAFIGPFVGSYETPGVIGQFGFSGWTTTNPPVGPPYRDVTGWFSLGFTLTWDPKPATATP